MSGDRRDEGRSNFCVQAIAECGYNCYGSSIKQLMRCCHSTRHGGAREGAESKRAADTEIKRGCPQPRGIFCCRWDRNRDSAQAQVVDVAEGDIFYSTRMALALMEKKGQQQRCKDVFNECGQ